MSQWLSTQEEIRKQPPVSSSVFWKLQPFGKSTSMPYQPLCYAKAHDHGAIKEGGLDILSTVAMEVSLCSLLVLLAVVCGAHGDLGQQESRLYQRMDRLCNDIEDFNKVLARKRDSLEKHAVHLHLLTDDVHKTQTEATEDKVFCSHLSVGRSIITIAGLALGYMWNASPYTAVAGLVISTGVGYFQEIYCSREQEQWVINEENVIRTFTEIDDDLRKITDMYSEIEEEMHDLEDEEGLLGTHLRKKLEDIKRTFSRFKPLQNWKKYMDMISQFFNMVLKLARNSAGKESVVNYVASKLDGYPKNALKAIVAAASLYQDGKKLYNGILHLNKGDRLELTENLWEVIYYLGSVIQKWDRFLLRRSTKCDKL